MNPQDNAQRARVFRFMQIGMPVTSFVLAAVLYLLLEDKTLGQIVGGALVLIGCSEYFIFRFLANKAENTP